MQRLLVISYIICLLLSCKKKGNLTGDWKGYYFYDFPIYDTSLVIEKDSAALFIHIEQVNDNTLKCTARSGSKEVYIEAIGTGKFDEHSNTVQLKETSFTQFHVDTTGMEVCLSVYNLKFHKSASNDELTGTQVSQPSINGVDCGKADVYLKKVKN